MVELALLYLKGKELEQGSRRWEGRALLELLQLFPVLPNKVLQSTRVRGRNANQKFEVMMDYKKLFTAQICFFFSFLCVSVQEAKNQCGRNRKDFHKSE